MKKKDLKNGMLIELRDGSIGLVVNKTTIYADGGYISFARFNNDLTISLQPEYDIVKVSKKIKGKHLCTDNWTSQTISDNLLWERKEPQPKEEPKEEPKETDLERYRKALDSIGIKYREIPGVSCTSALVLNGGTFITFRSDGEFIQQS